MDNLPRVASVKANVHWFMLRINYHKYQIKCEQEKLDEYVEWWDRFIEYCHTGK